MFLSERLITVRSSPNFALRVYQRIFSSILYTKILEENPGKGRRAILKSSLEIGNVFQIQARWPNHQSRISPMKVRLIFDPIRVCLRASVIFSGSNGLPPLDLPLTLFTATSHCTSSCSAQQ